MRHRFPEALSRIRGSRNDRTGPPRMDARPNRRPIGSAVNHSPRQLIPGVEMVSTSSVAGGTWTLRRCVLSPRKGVRSARPTGTGGARSTRPALAALRREDDRVGRRQTARAAVPCIVRTSRPPRPYSTENRRPSGPANVRAPRKTFAPPPPSPSPPPSPRSVVRRRSSGRNTLEINRELNPQERGASAQVEEGRAAQQRIPLG
jgi:hypothetical protein